MIVAGLCWMQMVGLMLRSRALEPQLGCTRLPEKGLGPLGRLLPLPVAHQWHHATSYLIALASRHHRLYKNCINWLDRIVTAST
jgi:hypothetical protein